VFERFTERARLVVVLAQDEARALKHNYIGTEHLLLGVLREDEGVGGRVLDSLDVTLEEVRAQVARIIGEGDEVTTGQIPFTPRSKKVLELALREAVKLGHNHIGTEHILLGIVRENDGVAARILADFDVDADKVRGEILRRLSIPRPYLQPGEGPREPLDVAPEFEAEIMRVRHAKERAIERQSFARAARLRDRERRLLKMARAGDTEAFGKLAGTPLPDDSHEPEALVAPAPPAPVVAAPVIAGWPLRAVAAGWLLFGLALGLGLLIGWLVWG
jgi:ATP-dependent Clp protease ATP-binding subunit ClpA